MSGSKFVTRRDLLAGAACSVALATFRAGHAAAPQIPAAGLEWLPAWQLRQLMAARAISPVEILEHFLQRITSLDPVIGAFETVDEAGAKTAALKAEAALMRGDPVGPLHGIPVAVKQMIAVEGLALETGEIASSDAVATERLRAAGAIILGNTALAGPAAMLGEAQIGAANPWDTQRVAGASSSGAAASVAAGLCPISLGSDGGGSTRLPSAWCGVIGLHPTVGRVPADHDVLRSQARTSWSSTYGPITRDSVDAATTLAIIAGPHWRHLAGFNGPPPDYLGDMRPNVRSWRFAWTDDFGGQASYFGEGSKRVIDTVRSSALQFERLGGHVEAVPLALADWYPIFTRIAAQLSSGPLYPLLAQTASSWDKIRGREPSPLWSDDIQEALSARQKMAEALLAVFEQHDILMSATSQYIAPTRSAYSGWLEKDRYSPEYTCLTGRMNLLGFPAISIPAGFVDGMPIGLQLIARPDEDARLLTAANAFLREQPWQPPTMPG